MTKMFLLRKIVEASDSYEKSVSEISQLEEKITMLCAKSIKVYN